MEDNFCMTGDDARLIMRSMMQTEAVLPAGEALTMYMRLAQISQVQPPAVSQEEPPAETKPEEPKNE